MHLTPHSCEFLASIIAVLVVAGYVGDVPRFIASMPPGVRFFFWIYRVVVPAFGIVVLSFGAVFGKGLGPGMGFVSLFAFFAGVAGIMEVAYSRFGVRLSFRARIEDDPQHDRDNPERESERGRE